MKFDLNQTTEESLLAFFRTSTRLDRAVSLVDQVEENAPGMFLVRSQSNPEKVYQVDLVGRSCDCPDWTHRGSVNGIPCKHWMAAYLAVHRKPAEVKA
jgi:hypothetical protein